MPADPVDAQAEADAEGATDTETETETESETAQVEGPAGAARRSWKPRRWELFLAGEARHPCAACCFFFLLGWALALPFLLKAIADQDEVFSFDQAPVKSSLVVQAYYGYMAARGKAFGCSDERHEKEDVCEADQNCQWHSDFKTCKTVELCPKPPPKPRSNMLRDKHGKRAGVLLVYEATNGASIFDDDVLGYMRRFEAELLTAANGAQGSGGEPSPWERDWCRKVYPAHGNSTGRCAPPNSLLSMFTMTEAGRRNVKQQVMEGYTDFSSGVASCLCGDQDAPCAICTPNGTARTDLPPAVAGCLMRAAIAAAAAAPSTPVPSAASTADSGNPAAVCNEQGGAPLTSGRLTEFLSDFCSSRPTCQWSPPWTGLCASTGYYASDWGDLVTGAHKEAVIGKMCDENNAGWWIQRKMLLPQSFNCSASKRTAKYARTMFFPGQEDVDNADEFENWKENYVKGPQGWYVKERQLERQIERESNGRLRIIQYSAATVRTQLLEVMFFDMLLSLCSMLMVWVYMSWALESFFLAFCAMFEIVFSLPVAFSLWTLVLQNKIIPSQMLVVYMILGIGADDAFVLYDAWVQARFADEDAMENWVRRFTFAYRKSFDAMFVTTLTTCGSFVIGAASPLPMVRDFCVVAAIVVLVHWLFCVSFFASAVIVSERYFKSNRKRGKSRCLGCCCRAAPVLSGDTYHSEETGQDPQKRGLERFCEGPLFRFLVNRKVLLIAAWTALIVGGAVSAGLQLRTAKKRSPVGREDLDTTRGMDILMSEYSYKGQLTVSFFYGLDEKEPIKEWSSDDNNVPKYGSIDRIISPQGQVELLHLCQAADLGTQDNTRCDLGRTCLVLGRGFSGRCPRNEQVWREQGIYLPDSILCENGRYCFMETFAEFWAATKGSCVGRSQADCKAAAADGCSWAPPAGGAAPVCYSATEPASYAGLPAAQFQSLLTGANFTNYMERRRKTLLMMGRSHDVEAEPEHTGWKTAQPQELNFAWVSFNASIPHENTVDKANDWYSRWETFRRTHGPNLGGFQTTESYLFMVIQNGMLRAAVMGIFLSLLVAYLVLMATTQNWQLSSLGLLNIVGISIIFLGIMPLLGWSLGENECIFLIAVVGLSVDYSVHLLVSYSRSEGHSRQERAKHALGEMGISVVNSATTTLLASVILFGCGFFFFFQFGAFVFFVIGLSILMSITFMIPLFLLLGPEDNAGSFPCSCRRRLPTDLGSKPLVGGAAPALGLNV